MVVEGEMESNVTEPESFWDILQEMDPVWTTTVLLVPFVVVLTAGFFYLYGAVISLLSKTSVRNKVVVITDALSGLGKECAGVFHKGGARLILCGKSWEKLEELADDLANASDPTVTFPSKLVLLDFGDMDSMPEAIAEILECYGCLDILILNSSIKVKAPAQSLSLEMDKLLMDNNYFGPATLAKDAASKHAVQAFFDCLRAEVEEYGISVSTINHTFISHSASENTEAASSRSIWSLLYTKKPFGVSPDEAAAEIVKTLNNKRKEVVIAPSLPKVAIYTRSFFPNVFFAVMAAGVNNAAASEKM
ncbi:dehydrogenase/reductase SDR family member 7C-B-like isoform X3 [Siniperca chuatsi]|uniref:dehydrogenase/reductase SDR family member 7C-B-like isoform X3 n=1 Tax=Siniperca chuatsi TaxID=119488 RepID=UPI001CE0322D|nr:dehydrogenase/reductase SDR family member 7C-B-like isoform X3 [Siniperca chuatsi]